MPETERHLLLTTLARERAERLVLRQREMDPWPETSIVAGDLVAYLKMVPSGESDQLALPTPRWLETVYTLPMLAVKITATQVHLVPPGRSGDQPLIVHNDRLKRFVQSADPALQILNDSYLSEAAPACAPADGPIAAFLA